MLADRNSHHAPERAIAASSLLKSASAAVAVAVALPGGSTGAATRSPVTLRAVEQRARCRLREEAETRGVDAVQYVVVVWVLGSEILITVDTEVCVLGALAVVTRFGSVVINGDTRSPS
jgi:hypothetical protein